LGVNVQEEIVDKVIRDKQEVRKEAIKFKGEV
jgi:hypothetical protein